MRRLAAQVRGSLEQLDGVLADLAGAAERIEVPEGIEPDPDAEAIAAWQQRWPEDARADDPRRFVETVRTYLSAAEVDVAAMETALDTDIGRKLLANSDLTPAQAILLVLLDARGSAFIEQLRASGQFVLVTGEMEEASVVLRDLPADDRVGLAAGSGTTTA